DLHGKAEVLSTKGITRKRFAKATFVPEPAAMNRRDFSSFSSGIRHVDRALDRSSPSVRTCTIMRLSTRPFLVFCLAFPCVGCGRSALLSTDALPLKRVVLYRNGVGYFERSGHVDEEEVRFKMKESEVGDFLATLAVIERGGSSVKAAAFPVADPDE